MPRSLKILENKLSGCPEASKSWKTNFRDAPKPQNLEKQAFGESRNTFITYGNQNNPKRQEGAPKFYLLTHTIPDFYTREKG